MLFLFEETEEGRIQAYPPNDGRPQENREFPAPPRIPRI